MNLGDLANLGMSRRADANRRGIKMRAGKILFFAVGAMLVATAARAGEISIVDNILGPEGPLFVDGDLYYVGWASHTLSKWDGETATELNHTPGCGHNGLALTKQKTFLLACTEEHGAILELDLTGKQLRRWDADKNGKPFDGGINDIVVTANGGAYATVFGPYKDVPTSVVGKILYLARQREMGRGRGRPELRQWNRRLSRSKNTLRQRTVGNCIKKFKINNDGSLSHRSNFALLNLLTPNKVESWWLGPDSMKVDSRGNIYVAQWFGGKILKISPDGKLLHVFEIAAGDGTTNVAFSDGEKELYVTVVKDPKDPQAKGGIVKIANVK